MYPQGAGEEMVELGLAKVIATKSLQTYGDEDMPALLEWIDQELATHIKVWWASFTRSLSAICPPQAKPLCLFS